MSGYILVLLLIADTDMQSSEFCPHWQKDVAPPLTHSMCSKNPPAVPRHTAPPGAVCGLFAQNLSVLRKRAGSGVI